MKLFYLLFLFVFVCGGTKTLKDVPNSFYTNSIREGYQVLRINNLTLKKIDTISEKTGKIYLFHYKN